MTAADDDGEEEDVASLFAVRDCVGLMLLDGGACGAGEGDLRRFVPGGGSEVVAVVVVD